MCQFFELVWFSNSIQIQSLSFRLTQVVVDVVIVVVIAIIGIE